MKRNGRTVLVCNCQNSMNVDGAALARACGSAATPTVHTALCRGEHERFEAAASTGEPLLVACTQEAPLFAELAPEDASLSFVNIRERAGWSDEGGLAGPKMAALLAEAALDVPATGAITLTSEGVCLVYGTGETALEAARTLAPHLDVTVLLSHPRDVLPPPSMDVALFTGTIRSARGWLGAFDIVVDGYALARPSSRRELAFEPGQNGVTSRCDIILDLTGGTPLFPAHEKRDGYLRPDPKNPAAVAEAVLTAIGLTGSFEKPRYVETRADLCAHARNGKTGCTRCLDLCPTGAITPRGEAVSIDPHVCAGCGSCAAVCPTGAVTYALPPMATLFERLRTLMETYAAAGGTAPVLLIHDPRHGDAMIGMMARLGRGLPARVIPFAVNAVTQVGLELFTTALAYGAAQVRVLTGPDNRDEAAGLAQQVALAEALMTGMGYGTGRVAVIDAADPDAVETLLWSLPAADAPPARLFLPMGGRRTVTMLGLRHLNTAAPAPAAVLPLPDGAPFGRVQVAADGCTLCLACVSVCPTGALLDNPDKPMLSFAQDACVQCGLCRATCPEKVITLVPEIDFRDSARGAAVVKEEEPFCCVRCGKPFAAKSSIDKIVAALAGKHPMFATPEAANRLRMCDDCRVIDQMEGGGNPFAMGAPRRPRTTDDDLRERDTRNGLSGGVNTFKTDGPTRH